MTFSHALFQLFIGPLEIIYQVIFNCARLVTQSTGLSILGLSLVMNILLLPLYRRADAIQDEERAQTKRMADWVAHIKKTFSGSERFMIQQAYYRQNGYKPYYALRGMLPLLLEVPFFIAAYHFLSNLGELRQVPFGPIGDLSRPDGLLRLGSWQVNVLPILMTVINVISGAIYTKGLPLKDKLQLYAMALVFLVLLYDSPSGLVVYWTMNNLFSLIKNLLIRLKKPRMIVDIAASASGMILAVCVLLFHKGRLVNNEAQFVAAALLQLPLLLSLGKRLGTKLLARLRRRWPKLGLRASDHAPSFRLFFSGACVLALLTGALIPTAVISASPIEFVNMLDYHFPMVYVLGSILLSAGLFMVWLSIFYLLSGRQLRRRFDCAIWILCGMEIVNYMFFGTKLGTLSPFLKYDDGLNFSVWETLINVAALLALAVLLVLIWRKNRRLVQFAYVVLGVALIGMSSVNASRIYDARPEIETALKNAESQQETGEEDGLIPEIRLSKEGRNVVVLMLDRAIGSYVPYLFAELPQLQEQFAGFTYYPNTLSHGGLTNFGAPGLFGGYEYTPDEMNKRDDEWLVDKHNEALRVMPVLFHRNDYDVTIIEPPYAGYSWIPDLTVFTDYEEFQTGASVKAYNVEENGTFNPRDPVEAAEEKEQIWERNFFCFGLMKTLPCFAQGAVYDGGRYYATDAGVQHAEDRSHASGIDQDFINCYSVLEALPSITVTTDSAQGTFLMMDNNLTHTPRLLQEPEYVPAQIVDNREYDAAHEDRFTVNGRTMRVETPEQMSHYHVNAAALLLLGRWMDKLREEGVYDNTRIIIVADHGRVLKQFDDMMLGKGENEDVMAYNPLLLVKDFDSTEFTTDTSFMTNADVPTLALTGAVEDPVNPFSGKPINSDAKAGDQLVTFSGIWSTDKNNGKTFLPGRWYSVHDDIFNLDNWSYVGRH